MGGEGGGLIFLRNLFPNNQNYPKKNYVCIVQTIQLSLSTHRQQQVVLIKSPVDSELTSAIKRIKSSKWSHTLRSWYVPYSKEMLFEIKNILGPLCTIDAELLKNKLKQNAIITAQNIYINTALNTKIELYTQWMLSKRYSQSTIKTYTEALKTFLKYYYQKPLEEISNQDIIEFNTHYILRKNLSSSYQNQVVNAIKLFFRQIENRNLDVDLIHRPKREKLLPNVLSKEEVKKILSGVLNLKHKAMLSVIYACGLRRGELLKLKPEHIDSKRGIILIKQAKGRKDRIAPLPTKIIEMLRTYYKEYKPSLYLFEGQVKGEKYNERSLNEVFSQAILKSKILKPATLHWLRHSYATHLLESGTDVRYIQELLGHKSIKTTEIYTHVSTKKISEIKSPIEDMDI